MKYGFTMLMLSAGILIFAQENKADAQRVQEKPIEKKVRLKNELPQERTGIIVIQGDDRTAKTKATKWKKNKAKNNHGQKVSKVARKHKGYGVSEVAKQNHGQQKDSKAKQLKDVKKSQRKLSKADQMAQQKTNKDVFAAKEFSMLDKQYKDNKDWVQLKSNLMKNSQQNQSLKLIKNLKSRISMDFTFGKINKEDYNKLQKELELAELRVKR